MPYVTNLCLQCDKEFQFMASPSRVSAGWGKFCSRSCNTTHRLSNGFKPSNALIGKKPHNYAECKHTCKSCGVIFIQPPSDVANYCSNECKYRNTSERMTDENSHQWKGDKVSYGALHQWVRRKLGTPKKCAVCGISGDVGKKRSYHWANVSGDYKRDLTDWQRLCVPCHSKFDHSRKEKQYATA